MSPPTLHPALTPVINTSLTPTTGQHSPNAFTNKAWTLPPRPKPGRKPALDNPPTRRKAQNRDAQRAFRERRAAKVGDLEQQMRQMEDEHHKEQESFKARIKFLENDIAHCTDLVRELQQRHHEMQSLCNKERQLREAAEARLNLPSQNLMERSDAAKMPSKTLSYSQQTRDQGASIISDDVNDLTCGKCRPDNRCQCVEEAFEMGNVSIDASAFSAKRSYLPQAKRDATRIRGSDRQRYDSMEIDFTSQFPSQGSPTLSTAASSAPSLPATVDQEKCGFCQDGTPCICAEVERDQRQLQDIQQAIYNAAPTQSSVKISKISCNQDPGSCLQCLSNPACSSFCKKLSGTSLSNRRKDVELFPDDSPNAESPSQSAKSFHGTTLSCANAFTTLSRHPAFPQASAALDHWVPQLTAIPTSPNREGRPAFEIEAASVMGVLRTFDRRFTHATSTDQAEQAVDPPDRAAAIENLC